MNQKIALSFGTRPEFIKILPVFWELVKLVGRERILLIHTGQHADLLERELLHFNVNPDVRFELERCSGSLSELSGKLLLKFEALSEELTANNIQLAAMIAQGDTASTYISALHAFHQRLPFFHVEAGLRTYDTNHPFPEEFYRRSIAKISSFHFAPTLVERQHLVNEFVDPSTIWTTGNTVIDHLHTIQPNEKRKEVLITLHRRELSDSEYQEMVDYFTALVPKSPDWSFKWISHPNRSINFGRLNHFSNFERLDAVAFYEFLKFYEGAGLIFTDSGGIQEEAAYLGIPCIVCRKRTERKSGVEMGIARLFDPSVKSIAEIEALFDRQKLIPKNPVYGDGLSGKRIAEAIISRIP